MYSATLQATAGTRVQPIDLTPLSSGVYVLFVKTEGGLDTRRIVKQ
ncbi:T9SS type A sorting domain-containing protein [Hymenobacter lapidarius]